MACQAFSGIRARRSMPFAAVSMRMRSPVSSSSTSSSSRAIRRSRSDGQRLLDPLQRAFQRLGRLGHVLAERVEVAFDVVGPLLLRRPGQHLAADGAEEELGRVGLAFGGGLGLAGLAGGSSAGA